MVIYVDSSKIDMFVTRDLHRSDLSGSGSLRTTLGPGTARGAPHVPPRAWRPDLPATAPARPAAPLASAPAPALRRSTTFAGLALGGSPSKLNDFEQSLKLVHLISALRCKLEIKH